MANLTAEAYTAKLLARAKTKIARKGYQETLPNDAERELNDYLLSIGIPWNEAGELAYELSLKVDALNQAQANKL